MFADSGRPIDVLWRRTDEERLRDDAGRLNALGAALREPLRSGRLAVVNAFGTGVADDKRVLPRVEDLIRYFLGEEPGLASAATYDLADPHAREAALDRLDELVIKPRDGSGGRGVLIGPAATRSELEQCPPHPGSAAGPVDRPGDRRALNAPHAQRGAPRGSPCRPPSLRAVPRRRVRGHPIAFSRFARAAGDLVVNCSRGGGGKDVWIVADPEGDG